MPSTLRPSSRHSGKLSSYVSLLTTVLMVVGALFIYQNKQYVTDTLHFWSYQPSSEVSSIADQTELTDAGTFALYAARPSIESAASFNGNCNRQDQATAVIGCYTSDRIYLYDVTDQKLDGIKEVTAAHEMLHAIYQRMSDSERTAINQLVEAEYKKLSADPTLAERMAFYAKTEPGERDNELHSIIGTEIGSISPELESHYAKYFKDRGKIVSYYNSYNGAFTSLAQEAKQLATQLDTLATQINTSTQKYNTDVKALNADVAAFNQRAESGGFASQSTFNSERQTLQERVDALSTLRSSIDSDISTYNNLKQQYDSTVTQSQELYKSVDSNLSPAPTV